MSVESERYRLFSGRLTKFFSSAYERNYYTLQCFLFHVRMLYFQATLANEIEINDARNVYALEFRKIDIEHNQSYSCTSDFCSSL